MINKYDKILYEALIESGLASKEVLDSVVTEVEFSELTLNNVLIKKQIVVERDILEILAKKLKLKYTDLRTASIDKSVISKIPIKVASYYSFLPLAIKANILTIAVSYPLDIKTKDEIRMQLGYNIEIVLCRQYDILEGLRKYYGSTAAILDKITSEGVEAVPEVTHKGRGKIEDIEKVAGAASVIKLVNQIISDAYKKRATDIHIEPYRGGVALRYRIDGVLLDVKASDELASFLSAIISRIKVMCRLNIVERRLPQDGRTSVRIQDKVLDLRISTMPTPFGESVVIRILPTQMLHSLEKLGLQKIDLDVFEKLIQEPHGIIFVTGPTGSGKTTTLYACLSKINTKDRKIITIEDPIECEMTGVTQIQVMPEIGLDFARGLRSVLRHDPDIMMIGEVRDLETAEIAIRVALTGHLVFSTLHTNDAASGIARLLDIGLEPYLVASSVEAFIAQRLLRVICPHCKYEDKDAAVELKKQIAQELGLKSESKVKIFRGKGCETCNFSGFFGRTSVYEILLIDDSIKDLVIKRVSTNQIKNLAIQRGMRTLRHDGWAKVISGVTTPEEVMRLTPSDTSLLTSDNRQAAVNTLQFEQDYPSEAEKIEIDGKKGENNLDALEQRKPDLSFLDKRVFSRLDSTINISYRVFRTKLEVSKRDDAPEHFSVTKDISAGGVLFIADEPYALGSFLELKIELLDRKAPIECLARIVRATENTLGERYEIAACFLDLTSSERNRINKICKSG